jgi:uncharacterized protein (DUF433 family)
MADMTSTSQTTERISTDASVLNGKPHLTGTRLSVEFIQGLIATGWTRPELLVVYPYISADDLAAALQFRG